MTQIPITKPWVGEREARAAAEVVRSGWLAMGAQVEAFEAALAEVTGARHAVAVSSGTAALHLALVGLGVGPGDEVLVPSLSYIATANAVRYVGARPVFVEVDPGRYTIDPQQAAAAVTARTRAILAVHQLGLPAELDALRDLAGAHGLLLLEDAACALGSGYRGQPIGAGASACCFSFHPRKVITTGEGGLVTTGDPALADRLRLLRSQGMSVPAAARHQASAVVLEDYPVLGYNYRLTDIQAAVGLAQLSRLPEILQRRRALAARYDAALAGIEGLALPAAPSDVQHSFQTYMVLLDPAWSRQAVMQQLQQQGIASRRGLMAIHLTLAYAELKPAWPLPISEAVARRGLALPLYPQLSEAEQDRVVQALSAACAAERERAG